MILRRYRQRLMNAHPATGVYFRMYNKICLITLLNELIIFIPLTSGEGQILWTKIFLYLVIRHKKILTPKIVLSLVFHLQECINPTILMDAKQWVRALPLLKLFEPSIFHNYRTAQKKISSSSQ